MGLLAVETASSAAVSMVTISIMIPLCYGLSQKLADY